ncbi:MAG TPA: CoA pyrophosphatase [Candidatus Stackebrandtia faecavium]|nr:CoA pyrophosphatase [Candidatus Stackebrandtia faecavium]
MTTRPVTDSALPGWWNPLAQRAAAIDGSAITKHLPPERGGKRSAVLVLLGEDERGPNVLVIQRSATLRHHAGQPGFPGGASDPTDRDLVDTALRETEEEVGLDRDSATIVTTLPELWIGVTNFRVTPVLAWWHAPHPVYPHSRAEVETVAILPVHELADPQHRLRAKHPSGYIGPAFALEGLLIWGFTAGVLSTVLRLGGWDRPWDRNRIADVS